MTAAGHLHMDHMDAADWASQIAERLPAADVRELARAAAEGIGAVHALRAATAAPVLRNTCDQLLTKLEHAGEAYVAGLLAGAARAVERAHRHQSVDVVWTGPESGITTSRLTAAAVIDLIEQARHEILLVSFATQTNSGISASLHAASARGVAITLLAERHADNPGYAPAEILFPGLDATFLYWPAAQRPQGAALHAKVIVVDDRIALVGSANLTSRAMEANLECGILIRGGPQPRAIRDHIAALRAAGILQLARQC
jgi:cardiolipin synthase A/B